MQTHRDGHVEPPPCSGNSQYDSPLVEPGPSFPIRQPLFLFGGTSHQADRGPSGYRCCHFAIPQIRPCLSRGAGTGVTICPSTYTSIMIMAVASRASRTRLGGSGHEHKGRAPFVPWNCIRKAPYVEPKLHVLRMVQGHDMMGTCSRSAVDSAYSRAWSRAYGSRPLARQSDVQRGKLAYLPSLYAELLADICCFCTLLFSRVNDVQVSLGERLQPSQWSRYPQFESRPEIEAR